jgi:DNA-binding MarR family transcriptional regulator
MNDMVEPRRRRAKRSPLVRVAPDFETEWPGASQLATACVLNLGVLVDQMAAFGEALVRRYGIPSRAAFNVLTILAGAGSPLSPSTVAARMVVSRPALTGVLATLERRGMVRRLPHPTDGRMALLEPTPRGLAAVTEVRPALHRAERAWLDCLTATEQRQLLRVVAWLQANAQTP